MSKPTMRRFVACVKAGRAPSADDLAAIASAFEAILGGMEPKAALGVAVKRGRKEKRMSDYPHGANPVDLAFEVMRAHRHDGLTVDAAKEKVSKTFHVARTTLDKYWKDNARLWRGLVSKK